MKDFDPYRDTLVRYIGYSNEVGEAFRTFIGAKWVAATYGCATLYVLAHTGYKTRKTYHIEAENDNRTKLALNIGVDTLIWQFLASVIIPGVTINRICAGSMYLIKKQDRLPKKLSVTLIGLAAIPIIIKPIDSLVDALMDRTTRKWF